MNRSWDLFCRVIDNYGDVGVCWRLARDLAGRGERVRLFIDDGSALAWMAPEGPPPGVEVLPWDAALTASFSGDVVVETFGCELPEPFLALMAGRTVPPRWINLEYLSAESYVERSHGLRSPQSFGPARGLDKRFFYPGFTPKTGGLLREPGLLGSQLALPGIDRRPGERVVSLFAYANEGLPALLELLSREPTLLLACPGPLQSRIEAQGALRVQPLPFLSQDDYDRLLWSCDLNFVRGEDSFVRAHWAGRPLVWHIYPQDDGAHGPKLEAWMERAGLAADARALNRAWNGLGSWPAAMPDAAAWAADAQRWRDELALQADLCSQLMAFSS
ncbi:elongation factor P maturation arginine rhamnosyltransferase EarP [Pelomonas sp. KK5]|uniref:elongation factor P maturation arginine rhamnosyltransferase EarP n=1 Tax=Pelomonas sp. KK5 TaxID=1855730 RepID=UPI00097C53D2|nr:elongation factor P maturation arginine rhamnosyltransferase EarP [Pelomonas sp. KK5]